MQKFNGHYIELTNSPLCLMTNLAKKSTKSRFSMKEGRLHVFATYTYLFGKQLTNRFTLPSIFLMSSISCMNVHFRLSRNVFYIMFINLIQILKQGIPK